MPETAGEDSQSFAQVLKKADSGHKRLPLINQGNGRKGRFAITDGNWKLVLPNPRVDKTELYDLASDRAEKENVAAENAEVVSDLKEKINRIIAGGRTTPGKPQANDTGYWDALSWLSEEEYKQLAEKALGK